MAKKIVKGIGSVAKFAVGGVLGSILGKKKDKPAALPAPEPVMPIADDEAVLRARRRSVAQQIQRGGRSSTILTDRETLGG